MEEVFTAVAPFRAEAFCECGGELKYENRTFMTAPPSYPHTCTDCQQRQSLDAIYPRIIYR